MTNKNLFLILGMGIIAAILVIDRFFVTIPDALAFVFLGIALISWFIYFVLLFKSKKEKS